MLQIRWAPLAQDDLGRLDDHYVETDPTLAVMIVRRILTAADFLCDMPLAGQATGQKDRRKWRVSDTPYNLFYRVAGEELRILRVLHVARDRRDL